MEKELGIKLRCLAQEINNIAEIKHTQYLSLHNPPPHTHTHTL